MASNTVARLVETLEQRCLLSAATANWELLVDNGPSSNRVDLVILGDGYTESELDTAYAVHIQSLLRHMFDEAEDPFPRYRNFFNVIRIDVISEESGVDQPVEGITRDTALNASYLWDGVTDRLAYVSDSLANAYVNTLPFTADMRFVTLNSSLYGGGGGTYAVYAGGNTSSTEVALHEVAHSFARLADEYDYGTGTYSGPEPTEINVTKSSSGEKWSEWLGYDQPGIGVIGAYEGARYHADGLYRPSENSKMRSLGQPFDAISREAFIRKFYDLVQPIDRSLSTSATVSSQSMLWADVIDPFVIQTQWYVDGNAVTGATGPYFIPADYGFTTGTHVVTLEAWDDTDWVRRGTDDLHDQRRWNINSALITAGLIFNSAAGELDLTEGGTAAEYQLRLASPPNQPVTVTIPENVELDISPREFVFTAQDWNQPRTVTVSARTDTTVEGRDVGEIEYQLETLDLVYSTLSLPSTRAIVRDTSVPQPLNTSPQVFPAELEVQTIWADGSFVGTLFGFDSEVEQTLTWSILSGNETGIWSLDPASGQLLLADASQLVDLPQGTIVLVVALTDNGTPALSSTTNVTITVTDFVATEPEVILMVQQPFVSYQQRGSTALLDPSATVQFFGGQGQLQGTLLDVKSVGKKAGKDRIVIEQNSDVQLNGTQILYQGTHVGTLQSVRPKQRAQIQFHSSATAVSVQAVIRALAFQTTAKKKTQRMFTLQLSNFHGAASEIATVDVVINFS